MGKAVIITNPRAGGGKDADDVRPLKRRLEDFFDTVVSETIGPDKNAGDLARQAALDGAEALFVVGGDGTINAVVSGVAPLDQRPTIGILPGGTNNTYAKCLGLPDDLRRAISAIDCRHTAALDIGQAGTHYFNYYLSFGPLLEATMSTSSMEKKLLGPFAYAKNVFTALPDDTVYPLRLDVDGETWEGLCSHLYVILSNTLGRLNFSEAPAALDDGFANVFVLTEGGLSGKLSALISGLEGQVEGNEGVFFARGRNIRLDCSDRCPTLTSLDGQKGPPLPLEIRILPRHINFYVYPETPLQQSRAR